MLFDIFPVLLAATLSALIWDFFFIPPRFTFNISATDDILLFAMYFIVAMLNAVLTFKIRQMESKIALKEEKERETWKGEDKEGVKRNGNGNSKGRGWKFKKEVKENEDIDMGMRDGVERLGGGVEMGSTERRQRRPRINRKRPTEYHLQRSDSNWAISIRIAALSTT